MYIYIEIDFTVYTRGLIAQRIDAAAFLVACVYIYCTDRECKKISDAYNKSIGNTTPRERESRCL